MEAALVNMDHIPSVEAVFVVPSVLPTFNTSAYRAYLDPSTQYYHVRLATQGAPPTPRPTRVSTGGPARAFARIRARAFAPLVLRPSIEDVTPLVEATSTEDALPSTQDTSSEEATPYLQDTLSYTLSNDGKPSIDDTLSNNVMPSIQDMTTQETMASPTMGTVIPTVPESASSTLAPPSLTGVQFDVDSGSESYPSQASTVQLSTTSSAYAPSATPPMVALPGTLSSTLPSPLQVPRAPTPSTQEPQSNWADLVEDEQEDDNLNTSSSSTSSSPHHDTSPLPSPTTPPTPDFQMLFDSAEPYKRRYIDVKSLSPRCMGLDLSLINHLKPRAVTDIDAPSNTFLRERFSKTLDLAIQACNNVTWAEYVLGIYRHGGYDLEAPSSAIVGKIASVVKPLHLRRYIPAVGSKEYKEQYDNELNRANAVEWREQDYVTVEELAHFNAKWQLMCIVSDELKIDGCYRRPIFEDSNRSLDWFWSSTNKHGSLPYDPREFSSPRDKHTPPKIKEFEEVHHLNFSHQSVGYKTATAPEVSLWAAWSIGLVGWRLDDGLTRRRVLASQAAKLLDPFYCDDEMDTAILRLSGDALRKAAAGCVRKVYSEGTWVNDRYDSETNTPVSGDEYQCIDVDCEGHLPVQPYIVYNGVDGDSNVNDDGRPSPFMPSKVHKPQGCSKYRTIESIDGEITIVAFGKVVTAAQPVVDKVVAQPERPRMFVFGAGSFASQIRASTQSNRVLPTVLEATEAAVGEEAAVPTDEDSGDASIDVRSPSYFDMIRRASKIPIEDRAAYLQVHDHIGGNYHEAASDVGDHYDHTSEIADVDNVVQVRPELSRPESSENVEPTPEKGSFINTPFTPDLSPVKPPRQYGMLTPTNEHALEMLVNTVHKEENTDDWEKETLQYLEDSPFKGYYGPRPSAPTPGRSLPMRVSFEDSPNAESLDEPYDEEHPSGRDQYESDEDYFTLDEYLASWVEEPGKRVRKVQLNGRLSVLPDYEEDFPDAQDEDFEVLRGLGYDVDLRDPNVEDVNVFADSTDENQNAEADGSTNGKKPEPIDADSSEHVSSNQKHDGELVVDNDEYYSDGQESSSENDEEASVADDNASDSADSGSHNSTASAVEVTPERDIEESALVLYDPCFYTRIFPSNNVANNENADDIAAAASQVLTQNLAYGAGDEDYFDQDSVIDDDEDQDRDDVPTSGDTTVAKGTNFSPEEQRITDQFLASQIPGLDQLSKIMDVSRQDDEQQRIQEVDETVLETKEVHESPLKTPWYDQPRYSENRTAAGVGFDSKKEESSEKEEPLEEEEVLEQDLPELDASQEEDITTLVPPSKGSDSNASDHEECNEHLELALPQPATGLEAIVTASMPSIEEDCQSSITQLFDVQELSEEELLNAPFEAYEDTSEIPDIRLSWPQFIYGSFTISLGQKAREILRFS